MPPSTFLHAALLVSDPMNFTKEEVLRFFTMGELTDPATLDWTPVGGIFRGTIRLRMHIEESNLSSDLLDAIPHSRYPDVDVQVVGGLQPPLDAACATASMPIRMDSGPRELHPSFVGFFQPFPTRWPFGEGEARDDDRPRRIRVESQRCTEGEGSRGVENRGLKRGLLEGTRAWLRKGNR